MEDRSRGEVEVGGGALGQRRGSLVNGVCSMCSLRFDQDTDSEWARVERLADALVGVLGYGKWMHRVQAGEM